MNTRSIVNSIKYRKYSLLVFIEFTELDSIIKVLFAFIYELVSEVYQQNPNLSIEVFI
jgi:hypothetical protein